MSRGPRTVSAPSTAPESRVSGTDREAGVVPRPGLVVVPRIRALSSQVCRARVGPESSATRDLHATDYIHATPSRRHERNFSRPLKSDWKILWLVVESESTGCMRADLLRFRTGCWRYWARP